MGINRFDPEEIRTDRLALEKPETEFDPKKEITKEDWERFMGAVRKYKPNGRIEPDDINSLREIAEAFGKLRVAIGEEAEDFLTKEEQKLLNIAHERALKSEFEEQFNQGAFAGSGLVARQELSEIQDRVLATGERHVISIEKLDRYCKEAFKRTEETEVHGPFLINYDQLSQDLFLAKLLEWPHVDEKQKEIEGKITNAEIERIKSGVQVGAHLIAPLRILAKFRLSFPKIFAQEFKRLVPSSEIIKKYIEQLRIENEYPVFVISAAFYARILLADDAFIKDGAIHFKESEKRHVETTPPIPESLHF